MYTYRADLYQIPIDININRAAVECWSYSYTIPNYTTQAGSTMSVSPLAAKGPSPK